MSNGQKGRNEPIPSSIRLEKPLSTSSLSSKSTRSWIIFVCFLLPHLIASILSPVQDCDEVFNYWEASHFLNHNYGFQTWEYSPVYAIRSWAYAGLHAGLIVPLKLIALSWGDKSMQFYSTRAMLGIFCACCETRLFLALSRTVNPRVALLFMLIMTTSTGMFHAATAYLPSSFAMYTGMLGTAEFIRFRHDNNAARGIFWFALGAILGWPFAGALLLPFLTGQAILSISDNSIISFLQQVLTGVAQSSLVLIWQTTIDSYFYGRLISVPWNIVAYNVFGGASRGPDIFGTEPWHYYLRNLALNFNIWLLLSLVAAPLLVLQHLTVRTSVPGNSTIRTLTLITPFYLWLAIFTTQPHKEERFMYPAYPFLAINAATSLHIILQWIGHPNMNSVVGKVPASIKLFGTVMLLLFTIAISILRSASLASGYTAPLKVYQPLHRVAKAGEIVCLGKEWYRYPSSYFLPNGVQARFVKSAFTGLLPGQYQEVAQDVGVISSTRNFPSGMNDRNLEDLSKYTELSKCTYLVDSYFPSTSVSSVLEPDFALDTDQWERVACEPFLDATATSFLGRLFWIPEWEGIPRSYRRQWAKYCLLKRKQ